MQDYQSLDTHALIELLAKHTEEYTSMLFNHDRGEAFDTCEKTIFLLQTEINSRAPKSDNTSITDSTISFNEKDEDKTNQISN